MKMNDCNYLISPIIIYKHRSHENRFTLGINFSRHSRDCKYDVFNYKNGMYDTIIY